MELPVVTQQRPERADAARNRQRILEAAGRLMARASVDCVSMEAIAAEAGVGKGTLFRRFGDRPSLLRALLSDREAAFQETLIRGAPPLGPGAPAAERLLAFGPAYLAFVEDNGPVLAAAERLVVSDVGPPHAFLLTHLRHLLGEAAPAVDAVYAADALLAPLRADLVLFQRRGRDMPLERLADGWCALARGLVER